MREHKAAEARQAQAQISPRFEGELVQPKETNVYMTPVKPVYNAQWNGYLTPPITPEGDCYGAPQPGQFVPRRPMTPTPSNENYLQVQPVPYHGYYQQ